jgi:hypothetical protein
MTKPYNTVISNSYLTVKVKGTGKITPKQAYVALRGPGG